MGRFAEKESPLTAATAVLMPVTTVSGIGTYVFPSDTYGGLERVITAALSATASVTLLALTGPGVISHFQVAPETAGAVAKIAIWIDDELAYEESLSLSNQNTAATQIGAVFGGLTNLADAILDPIPFKSRVLVTIETTGVVKWKTGAHWRLTD